MLRAASLTTTVLLIASPVLAYGPVALDPPPGAVMLSPGDDIQAAVDAHPNGTTFFREKGTYRLQAVRPKKKDVFLGAKGAVLNGAKLLTEFSRSGVNYVAKNLVIDPETIVHGECMPDFPRCDHPQDLYFDGKPLRAVAKVAQVSPGRFHYNTEKGVVTFADDPTGHAVELSHRAYAFAGDVPGVVIQNLTIQNYAAADQRGAINNGGGSWRMAGNEIRWNHGYGIVMGAGAVVSGNKVHHNGEIGIGGGAAHKGLVDGNEIAFNAWNGTDCTWECGGAKWAVTTGLKVTNNYVHDNQGNGLWTDIDCTEILYANNRIENNLYAGISHEISGSTVIRDNSFHRNGANTFQWGWQGQIQIQNSSDVKVFNNTMVLKPHRGGNGIMIIQQDRGSEHMPRNNSIHDNDITLAGGDGAVAGWFADFMPEVFGGAGNLFDNNRYHVLPTGADAPLWSPNDWVSFAAWQATGQDVHSTRDGVVSRPAKN